MSKKKNQNNNKEQPTINLTTPTNNLTRLFPWNNKYPCSIQPKPRHNLKRWSWVASAMPRTSHKAGGSHEPGRAGTQLEYSNGKGMRSGTPGYYGPLCPKSSGNCSWSRYRLELREIVKYGIKEWKGWLLEEWDMGSSPWIEPFI